MHILLCISDYNIHFNTFFVGGIDYVIQDYRRLATFVKSGKTYIELPTNFTDDDVVECEKAYCLEIFSATLPDRVIPVDPDDCKIVIRDDDSKWLYYYYTSFLSLSTVATYITTSLQNLATFKALFSL